jgi:hypothetical protein
MKYVGGPVSVSEERPFEVSTVISTSEIRHPSGVGVRVFPMWWRSGIAKTLGTDEVDEGLVVYSSPSLFSSPIILLHRYPYLLHMQLEYFAQLY